ncbi:unnamed protein product [Pleuronectes platessa]|uniref:Uncharacterized protein n=1 Tax=Pleuronectes platessa TaxID=8262 RepID=A0A9N7Y9L7_PLEPL|nr:unnamed protein product [Pleuronectes platessa]
MVGQSAKLSTLMETQSQPLQDSITALGSSSSDRLIPLNVSEGEVSQVVPLYNQLGFHETTCINPGQHFNSAPV